MYFDSPYVALRTFLKMFWSGRTGKKNEKRTVSKIAVLLGRYHSGELLNEPEHQLLTTAMALRNDLERALEIGGWLPGVDQKTLTALRRAFGGHFDVCVGYKGGLEKPSRERGPARSSSQSNGRRFRFLVA